MQNLQIKTKRRVSQTAQLGESSVRSRQEGSGDSAPEAPPENDEAARVDVPKDFEGGFRGKRLPSLREIGNQQSSKRVLGGR